MKRGVQALGIGMAVLAAGAAPATPGLVTTHRGKW